jgi:hypothetical protein
MSKFLLNFLLQISKALLYSKIKFLFRKEFSFTFGPIGPAASRPSRDPPVFQPAAPPLPTGHKPLGRPSSPSRPSRPRVGGALPDCHLPFQESVFLENRLPFTNAYSAENLPPPLGPYQLARPQPLPPPTGLGLPASPNRPAHFSSEPLGPRVPFSYFAEDVFFFDSRLPFSVPSLSPC